MWPKAIAQIVELLPHVSRVLPIADKFFQNKAATEDASRKALEAMAEGVRGDLGQVAAAHAGLYRQLSDQTERMVALGTAVDAARAAAVAAEARADNLERRLDRVGFLLLVVTVLCVVMLVLLGVILFRAH